MTDKSTDMQDTPDCPTPPRRLVSDHVLLKRNDEPAAWEGRRASKMRLRFPVTMAAAPAVPTIDLIAPVQPHTALPTFVEKPL